MLLKFIILTNCCKILVNYAEHVCWLLGLLTTARLGDWCKGKLGTEINLKQRSEAVFGEWNSFTLPAYQQADPSHHSWRTSRINNPAVGIAVTAASEERLV